MDTDEALLYLRKAKTAHLKWRTYAQALAAGVGIEEGKAPLRHTDCEFGRWYYGNGQELSTITPLYSSIEEPHRLLHEAYEGIYDLAKSRQFTRANEQLRTLEAISVSLLKIVDACMNEIRDR